MKKILYLIFPLILFVLPNCYRIKFDEEFNHLNSLTCSRTQIPLNMFSDPLEEEKINQMLIDGITRNDAVEIALKNNKDLQALFQSLGMFKSELVQSNLFTNPSIEVDVIYPSLRNLQDADNKGLTGTEILMTSSFQLSDIWLVPLKSNISKDKLELKIYKILNEILETIKNAREVYDNILYSKAFLEYGEYISDELEKIRVLAKAPAKDSKKDSKKESGKKSGKKIEQEKKKKRVDDILLDTQIASLKYKIISVNEALMASNYAKLKKIMGIKCPTSKKINIKDDIFNMRIRMPKIESLIKIAHQNHPDIFISLLRIKKAQDKLRYEEARIVNNASVGVSSVGPDPILTGAGPRIATDVPVLDQNQAQKSKAYYEFLGAEKELEATKIKITSDVYDSYEGLKGGQDSISVYQKALGHFSDNMIKDLNDLAFDKGLLGTVYLNIRFDVYNVYINYIKALKEFLDHYTELERAIGKRLDVEFDAKFRYVKDFKKKTKE